MTSTTQSSTKCPKCGAEVKPPASKIVAVFECGSVQWAKGEFEGSPSCSQISTLRASLAKAVEALKPFAGVSNQINGSVKDNSELFYHHSFGYSSVYVNMGDVRRASSVLNEISKDL